MFQQNVITYTRTKMYTIENIYAIMNEEKERFDIFMKSFNERNQRVSATSLQFIYFFSIYIWF